MPRRCRAGRSTVGTVAELTAPAVVVDGGERGCGELLLVLHAGLRDLPAGTRVRLVASDPAAPIDLPAWCHLTGHRYLGPTTDGGRPAFDLQVADRPRRTDDRPSRHPSVDAGPTT